MAKPSASRGRSAARELAEGSPRGDDRLGALLRHRRRIDPRRADDAASDFDAVVDRSRSRESRSLKDLYGAAGSIQRAAASPRQLPKRFDAPGPVVETLLAPGTSIHVKTKPVEFAFGGIGTNPHQEIVNGAPKSSARRGAAPPDGGVSLSEGSASSPLGTAPPRSVRIPAAGRRNVGLKARKTDSSTRGVVPLSATLGLRGCWPRPSMTSSSPPAPRRHLAPGRHQTRHPSPSAGATAPLRRLPHPVSSRPSTGLRESRRRSSWSAQWTYQSSSLTYALFKRGEPGLRRLHGLPRERAAGVARPSTPTSRPPRRRRRMSVMNIDAARRDRSGARRASASSGCARPPTRWLQLPRASTLADARTARRTGEIRATLPSACATPRS